MQKTPKPDPALAAERARAEDEKIDSMQDRLTSRTAMFLRQFGSRRALNGGSSRSTIAAPAAGSSRSWAGLKGFG
jgi:hypothetical protein